MKKTLKEVVVFALFLLLVVPTTPAMAASKKTKAMKAYAKYLQTHKAVVVSDYQYSNASYSPSDLSFINSFFLHKVDADTVPELFTLTKVNFRCFIIRIFTYKSGQVQLYKLSSGEDAEFYDSAVACGSYHFFICKKNHIHNVWSGNTPIGFEEKEEIYKGVKGKLKSYLSCNTGSAKYHKYSKSISKSTYTSLTQACLDKKVKYSSNTSANRKKLKQGKIKIR